MVKLPDLDSFGARPVASPQRAIAGYTDYAGQGMEAVGRDLRRVAEQRIEGESRLQQAYASGDLLATQLETLDSFEEDQDYATFTKRYRETMAKAKEKAMGQIRDPQARAMFGAQADESITRGLMQVRGQARQRYKEVGLARDMEADDRDINMAMANPAAAPAILANAARRKDANVAGGVYGADEGYKKKRDFADRYGKAWYENLPIGERAKQWQRGGFDGAYSTVEKNEGGFVASDGASGAPAIYGINRKWHPEAFDEAKRLTDEKGEEAGKAYAKEFYKKEYWDKNNIDALPSDVQDVVMDGVVNHHDGFAKDLVTAAKNGASRQQLLDMRQAEYDRLVRENPGKYAQSGPGWKNRLQGMTQQALAPKAGTPMDFMSPETKLALRDEYVKQQEANQKNLVEDPAQYMIDTGMVSSAPLDYANPAALEQSLAERAAGSAKLQQQGGGAGLFTKNEAQQVGFAIMQKPALERMQYLNAIRTASNGNITTYTQTMQQIRPDSPITAMSGLFMANDISPEEKGQPTSQQVALTLMKGEDLLNPVLAAKKENGTGKVYPMPSDDGKAGLRYYFNQYVGDTFRGRPEAYSTAYQAFRAYYAQTASDQGVTDPTLVDTSIAEAANKAVMGNMDNIGVRGGRVVLPWGMDETTFRDVASFKFAELKHDNGWKNTRFSDISLENTDTPGKYQVYSGTSPALDNNGKYVYMQFGMNDGERLVDYQTMKDRAKIKGITIAPSKQYLGPDDNLRASDLGGYNIDQIINRQSERMKAEGK